jgi:hypothetical protein
MFEAIHNIAYLVQVNEKRKEKNTAEERMPKTMTRLKRVTVFRPTLSSSISNLRKAHFSIFTIAYINLSML